MPKQVIFDISSAINRSRNNPKIYFIFLKTSCCNCASLCDSFLWEGVRGEGNSPEQYNDKHSYIWNPKYTPDFIANVYQTLKKREADNI